MKDLLIENWKAPTVTENIPCGDMPGDKVHIHETYIPKVNMIFPELLKQMKAKLENSEQSKIVIAVCGGSGVGKSGIASLISYYFNQMGIGSYTLSGDNYPHRIPQYNDAERLRVFRTSAIEGMLAAGTYTKERFEIIHALQKADDDANVAHIATYPWYESYIKAGKEGLRKYLGTTNEIDFEKLTDIIAAFKKGESKIWLKRMGREMTELWYDLVDFSNIDVLVIEWTHGNSDHYEGVDIPILLNSTPEETLAYRKARNRDNGVDSPFTTMVLEIEQGILESQAHKAKIIVAKTGELLSYDAYLELMAKSKGEANA